MSDQIIDSSTVPPTPSSAHQVQQAPVMSTTDWFITQLILSIPLVNVIMLLIWATSSTDNLNRRNFCRSTLLWAVIGLAIYALIFMLIISAGGKS